MTEMSMRMASRSSITPNFNESSIGPLTGVYNCSTVVLALHRFAHSILSRYPQHSLGRQDGASSGCDMAMDEGGLEH
jgi:hypothetical protein